MRIVVLGTGPFAVPMFQALIAGRHQVTALITRPDKPTHGKRTASQNPMREVAQGTGLPIFEPENINTPEAREILLEQKPDLLVVCDYGAILSPETLQTAPRGGINLHGSLLPKYRGAAPINWAIYHGEQETGVTVIHMTPRVDAGPCLAQATLPIGPEETAVDVEPRLALLGAQLTVQAIDDLEKGTTQVVPQDASLASRAPRLKKSDGQIDWKRSAVQIKNQVRAFEPWPKTYTSWLRAEGDPLRLIMGKVAVAQEREQAEHAPPGRVLSVSGGEIQVATGSGILVIQSVQPAGKRLLPAEEFLRGYPVQAGDQFGPAAG